MKTCETCLYFKESVCEKGASGEAYCLGGGRELWEASNSVIEPDIVPMDDGELEPSAHNEDAGVTEEDLQKLAAAKQLIADINSRPKTIEEGFNGIKKESAKGSDSCAGCINFTATGCFLGRYYECVDVNRFLYQGSGVAPIPSIEKVEEDSDDISFIDKLLED